MAGTKIGRYDYIIQLWKAITERARALGQERWPRPYTAWYSGTIDSVSTEMDGTHIITDADAEDWIVTIGANPSVKRWTEFEDPDAPYLPADYDIIIECDGPDNHVEILHLQILDNTATTLTVSSAADYVTAKHISSIGALEGAKYFIIKRGGWWHHERWPQFPNAQEVTRGTGTGGTVTIDSTTYSTLTDESKAWTVDLAGKDLVCWADDGRMHRVTIVSNDATTIRFAEQTWTASGDYCVVASGARAWAGRQPWPAFAWYGGATEGYLSHDPNDNLRMAQLAAVTVSFPEKFGPEGECGSPENTAHRDALDKDVWSDPTNYCPPHEHNYSRYVYATLRGLQAWIEDNCGYFVPPADYEGADTIPTYTPATLFHNLGINAGTSTVQGPDSEDKYYFAISSDYNGREVHWTIKHGTGPHTNWRSGTGTVTDGKVIVGEHPADADEDGDDVVWSLGWTRWRPRLVQRMFYPSGTCWIADLDDLDQPIDPPEIPDPDDFPTHGTGIWIKRDDVSTGYLTIGSIGQVLDTGEAFETGEAARYVGDNFADGTTGISFEDPAAMYWDHFYVGQRSKEAAGGPEHEAVWRESMAGTATAGTTTSLTDAGKGWWGVNWYHQDAVSPARPSKGNKTIRVDTGTATGGSTTTLVDSTKIDHPDNEPESSWWRAERFVGFDSPWQGFILEIDKDETTYKVPILSGDDTTGTLTFAAVDGLEVEPGDVYRIREPAYHVNQWAGRQLRLTKPDGTTYTTTITHNDDETLWFEAIAEAVQEGWTYQIIEHPTGGVWRWNGSSWEKPTGTDPRGADWLDDQRYNLPTKVKDYGRLRRGDYITIDLLTELYDAINKLIWTRATGTWKMPPADFEDPDLLNNHFQDEEILYGGPSAFNTALSILTAEWQADVPFWGSDYFTYAPTATPQAIAEAHATGDDSAPNDCEWGLFWASVFNYPYLTGVNTLLPCDAEFFIYSQIDLADHDDGETISLGGGSTRTYRYGNGGQEYPFRQYTHVGTISGDDPERWLDDVKVGHLPDGLTSIQPTDPATTPPSGVSHTHWTDCGFYIAEVVVILKWDGAFEYTA